MKKSEADDRDLERSRVILGLLESVGRDAKSSQRSRASEAGVALGLVNAYINFCVKKGYIRIKKIPTRNYFYYLTPKGFAEKSRLALMLVSNSLRSFRQARGEYSAAFQFFKERGLNRIVLIGLSELTEIAILCAQENEITVAAIVAKDTRERYLGVALTPSLAAVSGGFDAAAITDLVDPTTAYAETAHALGAELVAAPSILGVIRSGRAAAE